MIKPYKKLFLESKEDRNVVDFVYHMESTLYNMSLFIEDYKDRLQEATNVSVDKIDVRIDTAMRELQLARKKIIVIDKGEIDRDSSILLFTIGRKHLVGSSTKLGVNGENYSSGRSFLSMYFEIINILMHTTADEFFLLEMDVKDLSRTFTSVCRYYNSVVEKNWHLAIVKKDINDLLIPEKTMLITTLPIKVIKKKLSGGKLLDNKGNLK